MNQPKCSLSIVVPTYNRSQFLDAFLEWHIKLAQEYKIKIFVSDNHSTDDTKTVVLKHKKIYDNIHYHCNDKNINAENIITALCLSDAEYIWLMGDSYRMPTGALEYLQNKISKTSKKIDAFIFNLANNIKGINTRGYTNQNKLLEDIGAIQTCIACTVYHKSLIRDDLFYRYWKTDFPQIGMLFEGIADRDFLVQWIQHLSLQGLDKKELQKKNWSTTERVFDIGCDLWVDCVMSLPPSYSMESKRKCIMDFGSISGLLRWRNLIVLKANNLFSLSHIKKYKFTFGLTMHLPKIIFFTIAIMPKYLVTMLIDLNKIMTQKNK